MKIRKTNKVSVACKPDHLELGVVPKSTFLQRFGKLFREKQLTLKANNWYYFYQNNPERKIEAYQHRLELVRTMATTCNTIISIFVLLKVFGVLK